MADLPITRQAAEDFLVHEAELLDQERFEDWHALFTEAGTYRIPIIEGSDPTRHASLVHDNPLRLEERVYHLSQVPFPSQSPRSRTLHHITNVRVCPGQDGGHAVVRSNQIIFEMRLGDFRQVGLGEQRVFSAAVEHQLELDGGSQPQIADKCILLINRGATMSNLTFML